jgi:DNA mismatch repair protein MSH4
LALARVVGLPPDVLDRATFVSKTLSGKLEQNKRKSAAYNLSRRRRLVLKLKETLLQARDGMMEERALRSWLCKLQDEFVAQMTAVPVDAEEEGGEEEEGEDEDEHEEGSESTDEEDRMETDDD